MKYPIVAVCFMAFSLYSMQENHYFCSLNGTREANDSEFCMRVDAWLFACLCVEASKENSLDRQPFLELMGKIKKNLIDVDDATDNYVYMTRRDGMHRLLSYIRCDHNNTHCIVNGKAVSLYFDMFQTPQDIKRTTKFHDKNKASQVGEGIQQDRGGLRCYSGVEITLRHPELFEQDLKSLHTTLIEFENLLKK